MTGRMPEPEEHARETFSAYWLEVLGWVGLALGFASALLIILDILRGYRQKIWTMNLVYLVTAL